MPFGSAFGDEEALRDLAVREPLRHEAGDLAFPAGQLGRRCHTRILRPAIRGCKNTSVVKSPSRVIILSASQNVTDSCYTARHSVC